MYRSHNPRRKEPGPRGVDVTRGESALGSIGWGRAPHSRSGPSWESGLSSCRSRCRKRIVNVTVEISGRHQLSLVFSPLARKQETLPYRLPSSRNLYYAKTTQSKRTASKNRTIKAWNGHLDASHRHLGPYQSTPSCTHRDTREYPSDISYNLLIHSYSSSASLINSSISLTNAAACGAFFS
jgi:hypothetical protein